MLRGCSEKYHIKHGRTSIRKFFVFDNRFFNKAKPLHTSRAFLLVWTHVAVRRSVYFASGSYSLGHYRPNNAHRLRFAMFYCGRM